MRISCLCYIKCMKNRIRLIIGAVVLAAAAFIFLHKDPTVEVPDFRGQTVSDVEKWFISKSIPASAITYTYGYDDEIEAEHIISQSLEAGSRMRREDKLTIEISKGKAVSEMVSVPDFKGMTKEEITAWADLSGIQITFRKEESIDIPEGIFVRASEETGKEMKKGSLLEIVISSRQPQRPTPIPDDGAIPVPTPIPTPHAEG
ncbi:MAG TPA: hypothetical protein DHW39_08425 [Erysipelotrichaceae bacterium]|nr:hypothetical protein [Erysipelotrichaceae bacterium]